MFAIGSFFAILITWDDFMQINRFKFFYISLCLFFVVGAFVTAYTTGQQMENLPDTSWQRPEYFVGYFNNYLNQKVNPMTLGDILVTEYLERPAEPTGVFPLYPTQTVVQERTYVNSSITSIETYLVSGGNSTFGTTVGIGLYTKFGPTQMWKLQGYETISTAGEPDQTYEVTINTPKIRFGSEGGSLRIVITNFGTEISEVVYVPTIIDASPRSSFSGINTVVDSEDALFLTVKDQYQTIKGHRYYVNYESRVGIEFHRVAYEMRGQDIALKSNEIIALFGYPTLTRLDSDLKRYISFETLFDTLLPTLDKRFLTNVEELLCQVPIISTFFRYKRVESVVSHATRSTQYDVLITDYANQLMEQSQTDLTKASQPVIQTMLLSKERDIRSPYDYVELMTYFNETFVEDYNKLEGHNTYHFTQLDYKTYELKLTGQQQKTWRFDLTKGIETMITELNPIPGREDLTGQSFRGLLNDLNKLYYSSQNKGTTGIKEIKSRKDPKMTKIPSSDVQLAHLITLVEDISVPDYRDLQIISRPAFGTFEIVDEEGKLIQKYDMLHDGELAGVSVSLLSSNSEKIFLWLQKTPPQTMGHFFLVILSRLYFSLYHPN